MKWCNFSGWGVIGSLKMQSWNNRSWFCLEEGPNQLGAAFCYPIGFQLGADFKYKIEQKSCGWEMVRLFAEMVRLLYFWIITSALVLFLEFWPKLFDHDPSLTINNKGLICPNCKCGYARDLMFICTILCDNLPIRTTSWHVNFHQTHNLIHLGVPWKWSILRLLPGLPKTVWRGIMLQNWESNFWEKSRIRFQQEMIELSAFISSYIFYFVIVRDKN